MMLKNSLWTFKEKTNKRSATDFTMQMWENGKRRIWLFALLSFILLLSYPMFAALRLGYYGRSPIAAMKVGNEVLGISGGVTVFFVTLGGILCAVEGFSWLHSRKKTDMYLSQPITAGRRFAIIYLNGVLLYFVPYLVSLLLALLIVLAGAGVFSGALLVEAFFTVMAALVYFLAVYNLALIAVMISGKMGMTGFFVLMGFLYDIVFRTMIEGYYNSYFSTYYSQVDETFQYLSPTMRMLRALSLSDVDSLLQAEGAALTAGDILGHMILPMLPGLGILLLEAAAFGALAYYCYQKRPMEAASSAVAFPALKGPIKAVLIVLSGLLSSICFCEVASSYDFFAAAPGLVIGVLFAQAVMEIIYEGDIRAFARHKISFVVGAAAALCIYLFFALDISGYDTWVPSEKQVESAAIDIQFVNKYRIPRLDDEGEMTWDDRKSSPLYRMKLTDVSSVLSLAEDGMGKNAINLKKDKSNPVYCVVKYDMKNGGVKYREFFMDYEQEKTVLDILFANEEYKEGANQVLSTQMDRIFEKSRAYYNNGLQEKEIVDKDVFALMRAYQEDVRKMSFSDVKDTLPCGSLLLRYKGRDEIENTLEYPVFPSYTKTAKYLQEKNIALYLTIEPAAVDSLRFVVYNETEDAGPIVADKSFDQESISTAVAEVMEVEYTERSEIEEILTCLYPYNLASFSYTQGGYDDDIRVSLKAADGREADFYHWSDAEFIVKKELLPDFVKKDIGRE